jgi:hypothetical protein
MALVYSYFLHTEWVWESLYKHESETRTTDLPPHPSLRQSVNVTAVTTVSFQIRTYSVSCRSLLLHLMYFLGTAIFDIPFIQARSLLNSSVIKLGEVHSLPKPQYSTAQCCRGLLPKAMKALVCGTVNFRVHKNLTHCGRVTQICVFTLQLCGRVTQIYVFNMVKLGTSASSP